jgi:hypothetical protein
MTIFYYDTCLNDEINSFIIMFSHPLDIFGNEYNNEKQCSLNICNTIDKGYVLPLIKRWIKN